MALAATTQESTRVRSSAERCMARAIFGRAVRVGVAIRGRMVRPTWDFFSRSRERQLTADFFC